MSKKIFAVIKSAPMSAFISDFFLILLEKQNEHYLNLYNDFCQVTIENQRIQGLCKKGELVVLFFHVVKHSLIC